MMECDVFSIDKDGNLIVTTQVNYHIKNEDEYEIICDWIDELPNSTPFERIRQDQGIFTDWDDYAKKGIIAYDNFFGKNTLSSKPYYPLTIMDIPNHILKLLENQ